MIWDPIEQFKSYLRENSMTERQFAAENQINSGTLNRIMRLKCRPSAEIALKIQDVATIEAKALMMNWDLKKIDREIRDIQERTGRVSANGKAA